MRIISSKTLLVSALTVAGFVAGSLLSLPLRADQPHMQAALESLEAAERHLNEAEHDKGGHRAKALDHVHAAMREVREGISHDRHH
jgi:hypothetical protein